jgi:hypothetical protein
MSSNKIENVLVLKGGGSLGAFACGVFKALVNKNIKVAGNGFETSLLLAKMGFTHIQLCAKLTNQQQ